MPSPDLTRLRKAALFLHALPRQDRQRVWARLGEGQRHVLSPLLDELQELGIPMGRQWLVDDESDPGSGGAVVLKDDSSNHRTRVWALRADEALALLADQSVDTVALVLQMAPWPWRAEVEHKWPVDQRHALRARLEQHRQVPLKLADQLLHCLAGKLATQPVPRASADAVKRPWYASFMSLSLFT